VIDEKERLTWDQVFQLFTELEEHLNPQPNEGIYGYISKLR